MVHSPWTYHFQSEKGCNIGFFKRIPDIFWKHLILKSDVTQLQKKGLLSGDWGWNTQSQTTLGGGVSVKPWLYCWKPFTKDVKATLPSGGGGGVWVKASPCPCVIMEQRTSCYYSFHVRGMQSHLLPHILPHKIVCHQDYLWPSVKIHIQSCLFLLKRCTASDLSNVKVPLPQS